MAEDIAFVSGLRVWRNDDERAAARRIVEMQRGGAYVIAKRQDLFFIPHAHRDRAVSIGPERSGRDHQIEFFRQRMGILNFHFVTQLGVGPASPGFRTRDAAELFDLFRRAGHVKDKTVRFIANVVIDNLQHVDVTLIARGIDNRIVKRRFAFPLFFINMLDGLLSAELGLNAASLTRALSRRSHRPRPMDLNVIRAQQSIADRFYALGLIHKPVSVREAVWYGEATNSDLGLLMHVD